MQSGDRTRLRSAASGVTFLLCASICVIATAARPAPAQTPVQTIPLTTLQAIHALTNSQAAAGIPVAFEATVTYYNPAAVDLFVQQAGEAIYVQATLNLHLAPGDRVLVRGKTRDSFSTDIVGSSITLLSHGLLPAPVPATFQQLIRAQLDCMHVQVRATVRSADAMDFGTVAGVYLTLMMDGGPVDAMVVASNPGSLKRLLDAQVDVTGVVSGKFDSKMQLVGILLEVPSLDDVKILKPPLSDPDSLPIMPMDQILSGYDVNDLTRRVRVKGTITYYQPGLAAVLQSGSQSLWIATHDSIPMRIGDVAVATGFPDVSQGFLALIDGEVGDTGIIDPVQPQPATWRQLATWNTGDPNGHQNDLVSFDGKVVTEVREDSQDEFVLTAGGKLFTAIYRHPPDNSPLPPMRHVPIGATIRVTGICMALQANTITPAEQEVPFDILLRSFDDIAIVAQPSPFTVRNLALLVALLIILLLAAGAWAGLMERKVRRQNARAAYVESRRSRILEAINAGRPLSEVVEQITELASYKFHGAPCWCQIADGALIGNRPADPARFRIAQESIPARSGPPLGTIYAAFDPLATPRAKERDDLVAAAGLATLAIETRRLYSDLIHRSEYDLLTDIHNRFSLESCLDRQIEQARADAGVFGLVYIDLNDFKQVNDLYGHQVGDLYLRDVAVRMKHQLRAGDILARLGGDEFAVLLPRVRSRAEVQEVALRLERCLDPPFAAEGCIIHGSASTGIALFPEDGSSRDSLLSAADAAMYVNKRTRPSRDEARSSRGQGIVPDENL